jgi:hypothetical protein
MLDLLNKIFLFYYNWFKNLTSTSRKLWILIFIKSTLILTVLFLFFPHILNDFETDAQRANFVADNLLK